MCVCVCVCVCVWIIDLNNRIIKKNKFSLDCILDLIVFSWIWLVVFLRLKNLNHLSLKFWGKFDLENELLEIQKWTQNIYFLYIEKVIFYEYLKI